jgi:hypothetical protein
MGTNIKEQHTDRTFRHTDQGSMVLQPTHCPNRNPCKRQLADKNFHLEMYLNCHGSASQCHCAISILTAHLPHAHSECVESMIMLNEQVVLAVIQHVL